MKYALLTLFLVLMRCTSSFAAGERWLFVDGHSDYDIVVAPEASVSELKAAADLKDYLKQVGNVEVGISRNLNGTGCHIYIGYNAQVASLTGAEKPDDSDEKFVWCTVGDDLCIYGGRQRGTMYGVYRFIAKFLGVRWYTKDFTKIPHFTSLKMPDIKGGEKPAFRYRHLFYYTSRIHHDWDAHNCLNSTFGDVICNVYGDLQSYWDVHTMGKLISPAEFFRSHPEFFSMRNGRRISDGQLCLSNPRVVALLKNRVLEMIKTRPGHWCYSVSQNDNQNYCECEKCKSLERRYGGHAGLLLWAINQIADTVGTVYPRIYIGTLAYHYTQTPPSRIKPRNNVVIRLCNIESCFSHPINAQENSKMMRDLSGWLKLTNHVFWWEYATNFYHYLLPFPNFHAISDNLRILSDAKITGVMIEGQYEKYGGEFFELKQWLLAQLLWNPYQNIDSLAEEFIRDYYGAVANSIIEFYRLTNQLVNEDHHLMFTTDFNSDIFTDDYILAARKLLDGALKKVRCDSALLARVEQLRVMVLYLQANRYPSNAHVNRSKDGLTDFFRKYDWNVREGEDHRVFIKKMDDW